MKKYIKYVLIAVAAVFALYVLWVRLPVRVDPEEVTECPCIVDDTQVRLQPYGYNNPQKKKEWKITTEYDEAASTLYVTCWLKARMTFSSFSYASSKINRADFGEIDKVVLVGGFFGQKELTVWEDGVCTLPPSIDYSEELTE